MSPNRALVLERASKMNSAVSVPTRVALLALVGSTCLLAFRNARSQSSNEADIFSKFGPAIVQLHALGRGPEGQPKNLAEGTGVLVSSDGHILTARHVVGDDDEWFRDESSESKLVDRQIEVRRLGSHGDVETQTYKAPHVHFLPNRDLAIFRVPGSGYIHASVSKNVPRRLGKDYPTLINLVWVPSGGAVRPAQGKLTETVDPTTDGDVLTLQLRVIPGYSGSPVFDLQERIVGIVKQQKPPDLSLAEKVFEVPTYLPLSERDENSRRAVALLLFNATRKDELSLQQADAAPAELDRLFSSSKEIPIRSFNRVLDETIRGLSFRDQGIELDADTLVTGDVKYDGKVLRLSVRIINAPDETTVWVKDFSSPPFERYSLMPRAASAIAEKLHVKLEGGVGGTNSTPAYASFQRGETENRIIGKTHNNRAIAHLERAVAADPAFASALSELANAYVNRFYWNYSNNPALLAKAEASAQRALAISPNLPLAHYALAQALAGGGKRRDAIEEYYASVRLAPDLVPALSSVARWLFYMGDLDQSMRVWKRIEQLERPQRSEVHVREAMCLYFSGHPDDSLIENKKAEYLAEDGVDELTLIAFTYVWLKDFPPAERVLARLKRVEPSAFSIDEIQAWLFAMKGQAAQAQEKIRKIEARHTYGIEDEIATLYAVLGDKSNARSWLQMAISHGAPLYAWYHSNFFRILQGDAVYEDLMRQLEREYEPLRKRFESEIGPLVFQTAN